MEIQNKPIEKANIISNDEIEAQSIISPNKFIILSVLSFGLYNVWWIYKSWRFFQQKEKSDIMPALRAIFSIIFLIPLFDRILIFARAKGYKQDFSSVLLFIGIFVVNLLIYLPDPFGLVTMLGVVFYIPPYIALNFALRNSSEFKVKEQVFFNSRQFAIIVIGIILWFLVIMGLILNLTTI